MIRILPRAVLHPPRALRRLALLTLAALGLNGCLNSVLPEPESSRLYTLPAGQLTGPASESPWQRLLVESIDPVPALDSDRLLAIDQRGEVRRIAEARWIARPAELVQVGLSERLRQLGAAKNVDRQSLRVAPELRLLGELSAFQFDPQRQAATVVLNLQLLCAQSHHPLDDRRFEAQVASSAEAGALIAALGEALDQVAQQIQQWVISQQPSRCGAVAAEAETETR